MFKIKLFSPSDIRIAQERFVFDKNINDKDADAFLIYYDAFPAKIPSPQKTFWWSPEPRWHSMYRSKAAIYVKKILPHANLLSYREKNPAQRIPHQTHIHNNLCILKTERKRNIGAVVSNFGDSLWFLRLPFILRNYLITRKNVSLYGRYSSWKNFPHRILPNRLQKPPKNYCGEIGGWVYDDKTTIEKLSAFHALICLENSYEPFYFTEKLVFAVAAGCVPIYLPHPTVSKEYLDGCFYINPSDYMYKTRQISEVALSTSIEKVWDQNQAWLYKFLNRKDDTREDQLWNRVGNYICNRLT